MNRTGRRLGSCLLALLLIAALATVPAVGSPAASSVASAQTASTEPPQAEAGLDQTVERNASVLLDATQSVSPSGEIVAYDWSITSPSGGAVSRTCDSSACGLARFRAPELGEYSVTVTVTDDAGQTASDTLYVTVVPRGDFGVELEGPANATGQEANLTTTISPGASVVENVTWYRGDQVIGNQSIAEIGGVYNYSTVIVPGATYRAVVADQWNQTVSDTWSAPGDPGNWTPATPGADQYPRIEGPATVTGSYDGEDAYENWEYDGVTYTAVSSEYGSVTKAVWSLQNDDTKDFSAEGTQVDMSLDPGVNTIIANLDMELDELATSSYPGTDQSDTYDKVNDTTSKEVILQRTVVVNPEPRLRDVDFSKDSGTVSVEFFADDPYREPETARLNVDDQTIAMEQGDFESHTWVEGTLADSVSGETTVRLEVEDKGGQISTESTTIYVSDQTSETADTGTGEAADTAEEIVEGTGAIETETMVENPKVMAEVTDEPPGKWVDQTRERDWATAPSAKM